MQNNVVKAFRQRLIRAGFRDITIYDCCNGEYIVYATDSFGVEYRRRLTELGMASLPRIVWFESDDSIILSDSIGT